MPSVRVVLGNAASQDWEIHQVDIKSAYLNAPLKETIYMKPPRGVLNQTGGKGLSLAERSLWTQAGRSRMAPRNVQGLHYRPRIQTFSNRSFSILQTI